jgi:putative aldouronate transport system substrate-binding protein
MSRRAFLNRSLAAAAGLAALGLVQCSPTEAPPEAPEPGEATKAPAAPPPGEKVRITISNISGGSQEGSDEGWIWAEMAEALPDIEPVNQWVSYASYKEKIPLMIASGDIADLQFCHAFNDIPLMMEDMIVHETGALLEEHGKNILAVSPPHIWESTNYGGKQYAVSHNVYSLDIWHLAYRKDWLDKLGLSVPGTLDEVKEVLAAFTKDDPDGNGTADTYGRQLYNTIRFDDDFFHAYGVAIGHHMMGFWRKRGAAIELDWVQPEMKEALAWMRDRWAEGVIHPESLTVPLGQRLKNWNAGFTGQAYTSFGEMDSSLNSIRGVAPDAELVAALAPTGPGGSGITGEDNPWCYVCSAQCEHPEAAIRIIDWMCSPEMTTKIMCGGIPGVTEKERTSQGWCVEYTMAEKEEMGAAWTEKVESVAGVGVPGMWGPIRTIEPSILATLPDDAKEHFENILKNKYSPAAYEGVAICQKDVRLSEKMRPVAADRESWPGMQTRFSEFIVAAVAGTQDLDAGWKEWLDFFEKNGGPEMTEQVNAG